MGWAPNKELEALCFFGEKSLVFAEAFLCWRESRQSQWFPGGFEVPTLYLSSGENASFAIHLSSVQLLNSLWPHGLYSTPGFPVHHQLPELLKLMSIESVMPPNHLTLCCPLLLLPSIFPSISIFSNESVLHIRWPKYWSFSFSISSSNEYSGLISFRIDWFDSLPLLLGPNFIYLFINF